MTQSKQRTLARAAGYTCTHITDHGVSTLDNRGTFDVALHLHSEEVTPVAEGGYGIVPVSLGTVVLSSAQARQMAADLYTAAERADGRGASEPAAPAPSAPTPPRRHGKAKTHA